MRPLSTLPNWESEFARNSFGLLSMLLQLETIAHKEQQHLSVDIPSKYSIEDLVLAEAALFFGQDACGLTAYDRYRLLRNLELGQGCDPRNHCTRSSDVFRRRSILNINTDLSCNTQKESEGRKKSKKQSDGCVLEIQIRWPVLRGNNTDERY